MRLCDRDFGVLRAALERVGVAHLSSPSHVEAVKRYDRQGLLGDEDVLTIETFDGTLVAYAAILDLAAEAVGQDGRRYEAVYQNAVCPICSFKREAIEWVPQAADVARCAYDRLIGGHA